MNSQSTVFQHTLEGLQSGLRVRHIATPDPITCNVDTDVGAVLSVPDWQEFDQFPVVDGDQIVGVVERQGAPVAVEARSVMRAISGQVLVSADEPISTYIALAPSSPYRLVLDGARITGIVTKSDLQKLPVRLHVFTHVTHLETVMRELILGLKTEADEWLTALSPERQGRIRSMLRRYQDQRMDPHVVDLTMFSDKVQVINEFVCPGSTFQDEADRITDLRNKIAHGNTFIDVDEDLAAFVETLDLTSKWIEKLTAMTTDRSTA